MHTISLMGDAQPSLDNSNVMFCPSILGLTEPQADLAIVMPRLDHNRQLRETRCQGTWAAILACDPFGSEVALFSDLREKGYRGLANWPSTILLDGSMRQSMSTIPASPEHEYAVLARAKASGLQTLGFFRALEQARAAIDAGLNSLVLHPGLVDIDSAATGVMVNASLQRLVKTIRAEAPGVTLYAYTSNWHEAQIRLSELPVDGLIWYRPVR